MLSYVLGTLVILLLVILFRYLPHRVFLIFVTLLLVLVGVIFYVQTAERTQEPLTMAERAAITHDQELFIPWWGDYQKQIAELDRTWTRYHQILADAKAGEHTIAITHARLVDLEQDMRELRARIAQTPPPTELSDRVYDPLAVIMAKTDEYAAAEQKAITLTRAAADPQTMKEKNPAEQARLLELVMLRESPVALFVGDEIGMVRHYFAPISAAQTHTNPAEAREEKSLDK
ncbi:hypothetical protein [Selenomonas dianae]|uniref:LemA family protein n=1 Tax=Selenomonas dianae TaxID=135079 RepID=A0ABN0TAH5_9FIRM|nr:hypothetical protein [Selenomonas dianae]WLD81645.1 hypothetical protein QU667_07335 [Selenomonas dianae]